jgi:formamidopyrimidine-DNA glycosylase
MPELPDITVYIEALERRVLGRRLTAVRITHPFLLRSTDPPLRDFEGRAVEQLRRLGKRIAFGFEGGLWLILHLMIAGRLHWQAAGAKGPARRGLASFEFESGTLSLTEAGSKRRAALHTARGEAELASHQRGGLEPLEADLAAFAAALRRENHTLKRALTDPTLFSGIGNAYSDEILHAARLSPVALTAKLGADEVARLHAAVERTLRDWIERLRVEAGDAFPEKVTAFRAEMAVHGRFGRPCPACGTTVQRIRCADNETNYCPRCQTEGRVLADRALSRLLHGDWPRSIEELEEKATARRS